MPLTETRTPGSTSPVLLVTLPVTPPPSASSTSTSWRPVSTPANRPGAKSVAVAARS